MSRKDTDMRREHSTYSGTRGFRTFLAAWLSRLAQGRRLISAAQASLCRSLTQTEERLEQVCFGCGGEARQRPDEVDHAQPGFTTSTTTDRSQFEASATAFLGRAAPFTLRIIPALRKEGAAEGAGEFVGSAGSWAGEMFAGWWVESGASQHFVGIA